MGVLGGGARKNSKSLSSPKLELWPKKSKKGERMCGFWAEVHAKTTGVYQVPKLRNLKSGNILDTQTDRHSDLYYPLTADKNDKLNAGLNLVVFGIEEYGLQ